MGSSARSTVARLWQYEGSRELLTALAILLFAAAGILFINPEGSEIYAGAGGLTWQTLPFGYASLLGILGLIYLVQAISQLRAEIAAAPTEVATTPVTDALQAEARTVLLRRIGTVVALVVYAMTIPHFGFLMMTPVFLLAMFRLYSRGSLAGDIGFALIGGPLLWLLFVPILKLDLAGETFDPLTTPLLHILRAVGI